MSTFSGPNGINTYLAIALKTALSAYLRSGLIMNRKWKLGAMLRLAGEYTGECYKLSRAGAEQALHDIGEWIEAEGVQHG